MTAFGADVLELTLDPLPLLLALPLVRLLRSPAHAALVVLNLWLFMELLTTLGRSGLPVRRRTAAGAAGRKLPAPRARLRSAAGLAALALQHRESDGALRRAFEPITLPA